MLSALVLSLRWCDGTRILIMGQGDAMMAFTIGVTMPCTVIIAKVVGCTLPLVARKSALDPAIMATPFNFYIGGYQYYQCIFCYCKFCISVIREKRTHS